MAPLRSVLFVPGNKAHMLEKARTLPADAVILDLEDGVPQSQKRAARSVTRVALEAGSYEPQTVLRINAFYTGLAEADLRETFTPVVQAVCLPKAETTAEVERLDRDIEDMERQYRVSAGTVGILLMVETALGVLNAYDMARASRRVRALCLGGEDLVRDLGGVRTKDGLELTHSRAHLVLAARAAGVLAVDTIYTDLTDPDGLLAEARQARQLGYSGKFVVHPAQIDLVHQAFAPTSQQVSQARRSLEAFEAAEARGDGVIALDGQMMDAPVIARAREILGQIRLS
jgi:citrate lyase subunit beta/citryl-CoA lyase